VCMGLQEIATRVIFLSVCHSATRAQIVLLPPFCWSTGTKLNGQSQVSA
jgi:hypothetical protein